MAPEQYTVGHTIVISKKHAADQMDEALSPEEHQRFWAEVRCVSKRLRDRARNEVGEHPVRIYVCILCDGTEHLHAHLIPRYPFSYRDEVIYRHELGNRDGAETVRCRAKKGHFGGFWFIAERERNWKDYGFGMEDAETRAERLAERAEGLRRPSSERTD